MKKSTVVYAAVAVAALFYYSNTHIPTWNYRVPFEVVAPKPKYIELQNYLVHRYKIDEYKAQYIIQNSLKYSNNTFPRLEDTLAIIAIESAFDLSAVSTANAKGLMQILYKKTSFNISDNIVDGTKLLKEYYRHFGNIDATVQAYNVGIGAYKQGQRNQAYLAKFKQEKKKFKELI